MHRRVSLLALLALLASLLPFSSNVAQAATFRTFVAQVPGQPGTGPVRIWMNSDTALGETAGIETLINGSYTKRLGTFNNTSYPGANWYVDIPGQSAGTTVAYQLFTRNQTGSDYGFTGFNWNYTVSGLACAGGVVGDNNVLYAGLFHDSFSPYYRSPAGPLPSSQGTLTLRFRSCQSDIQQASLRVWNDRSNAETIYPMTADGDTTDASLGPVSFWKLELPIPTTATALYYTFRATDGTATGFYRDDDPKFLGGGFGQAEANQSVAYDNSYQVSVFDPAFFTPAWMQRGIIYQIFPDRFRDGNTANDPSNGRFSYGANVAIVRSNDPEGDWNSAVCDPRTAGPCFGRYGDNFYGGDLQGITQKLIDGYFSSLGVTILYLNPIFRAPSNHKYDTANFMEIDPDFGTLADFQAMVTAANARGIRVMLDGVFNHTSSDSPYFDRYHRYDATGTLTAPNGGTDDDSGACEAISSAYRSWFYFPAFANAGSDGGTTVYCADASGNPTVTYEAWYGYSSLPKIQSSLPQVRNYFYGNPGAVGPYWTALGASAWRFDVGADVDPGLTNDPNNDYWEGFRAAVRNQAVTGKNDTVMLGEEWGDATPWLLGNEWDSVMNYRFRSAVLSWMFTGCSGNGCTGGNKFQENDSNDNSSSGAISYLSPSQFNARLRSIAEDYPANAFKAMMNLSGSHDTQRLRFLLKKINNDNDGAAIQRMKEWWLFAFTYAGNPTLYYGDEVGLSHDGVWDGSQYQDDPYNRTPFPWPDASGSAYIADTTNLLPFARQMASIRQSYRALQDGDVQHGLVINDAEQLYGYARTNGTETALILLNRSSQTRTASFSGLNAAPYNLPNGTLLRDVISGTSYTVTGGSVNVTVTPTWGAVLLEQSKIDTPASASVTATGNGNDVVLNWPMVTLDPNGAPEVVTSYTIHRSTSASFTADPSNQIASLANPAFGGDPSYTDTGAATGGYTYIVRACNAAGICSTSSSMTPSKVATTLTASPASGVYGGNVTLSASLSAGSAMAGRAVSFSLNGSSVGSATADINGVATVTTSLGSINAGSYPTGITAAFAGDNAYSGANTTAALTVSQASATITLSNLNTTYTGSPQAASASTNPAGLNVLLTYNGSSSAPTSAGSYTVVATLDEQNYTGSATGTLVIGKATATVTLDTLSVTYDGSIQSATASTSPAGLSVNLSYSATPINAGSYSVTATVDDSNYTGSATGTLVVNPASATISLANLTQGYTGSPSPVEITTTPAGLEGDVSVTYAGSATAPTSAGSYAVVATLNNPNYSAPVVNETLTVLLAEQTISFAALPDRTYGDPDFTVSATANSGLPVSFSAAGTCSISGTTVSLGNAGTCSITASQAGTSNYDPAPTVVRSFTIQKASASLSLSGLSQIYTGSPHSVTVTTTPTGLSGASVTYDGSVTAPTSAGSYAVIATLDNPNYTAASATGTLVVAKATATVTLSNLNQTYDGTVKSATASTSPVGLSVNLSYSATPINAGSYSVTATINDPNYSGSATGTLVITKATATVTLSNLNQIADGSPKSATVSTSPSGLNVTITYNGSTTAPSAVGSYTVVATINDANYQGSATGTLVISSPTPTYNFSGFFAPVDNPPIVNIAKAGSAIPVKFSLGGNFGLNIFQAGYPSVVVQPCSNSAPTDAIETTVSASVSSLSYDPLTNQYTYVWKTDKTWAKTCRQLVLNFNDGTTKTATFSLKK